MRFRRVARDAASSRVAMDQSIRRGDFKSLDTALTGNDPLFEQDQNQIAREAFPWIDRADRRSVTKLHVAFGFPGGQVYAVAGEEAPAEYTWEKSAGVAKKIWHPQTVPREDFQDGGAVFLQAILDGFTGGYLDWLNQWCFTSLVAAGVAKAGVTDQYAEVAIIASIGAESLTSADVDALIAELPASARRGACFAGDASMASLCRKIRAGENGAVLWQSAREGELPTLADRPFIEDESVAVGTLIFANPYRCTGIAELESPMLHGLLGGADVQPQITAKAAVVVKDARACKILQVTEAT